MPAVIEAYRPPRFRLRRLEKRMTEDGIDRRRRDAILQLADHFRRWPEPIRGVEVGVYNGKFAKAMLDHLPGLGRLILADPWREFPADHPDRAGHAYARRDQAAWDATMAGAMDLLGEQRLARCAVLRTGSLQAAQVFRLTRFQAHFAYIDADHTYQAVKADIAAWWPLVLPGGVLCGDDYRGQAERRGEWGVGEAVDEFARERGLWVKLAGRNWFIFKR